MTVAISTWCPEWMASVNVGEYIKQSSTVNNITTRNNDLNYQITNIKEKIKNIKEIINRKKKIINEEEGESNWQNLPLQELVDNVQELIDQNCRIKQWINYVRWRVIVDTEYLNFEEWAEKYYVRQSIYSEDFKKWDLYINANQKVEATNAIYVNIRDHWSEEDYSANDWQEMYDYTKTSVLSILGINPVDVTHPYHHEWTVNIDPEKLQEMIENLKHLDLTHTDVSLNEIYFDPEFKESVTMEQDLKVGNTIKSKDFIVHGSSHLKHAHIKAACIEEITCPMEIRWDLNVRWSWDAHVDTKLNVQQETKAHDLYVDMEINIPGAEYLFIDGEQLSDWLKRTVLELDLCLCCACPPPPPPAKTCADYPPDQRPAWCDPSCTTCKSVQCCEWYHWSIVPASQLAATTMNMYLAQYWVASSASWWCVWVKWKALNNDSVDYAANQTQNWMNVMAAVKAAEKIASAAVILTGTVITGSLNTTPC